MTNQDLIFLRNLPAEIVEKLGDVSENKLARLKEIDAIVKSVAQVVREERSKRDGEIRDLNDELRNLQSRITLLESMLISRDLEQR